MVKILTDKKTDKILGAWIIGTNAGEMIAEGTDLEKMSIHDDDSDGNK